MEINKKEDKDRWGDKDPMDKDQKEEKKQKNEEEKQSKSMPNFNPSSYMNNMSSITNKFK